MCESALISALYVILTLFSAALGLSSSAIQLRFSEALTILPYFTSAAVPGLTIGCILANAVTGCPIWDVVAGSAATLIGTLGTRYLSRNIYVAPIWPILSNTLIIPLILRYVYAIPGSYLYFIAAVFIGEFISCWIFGTMFGNFISKNRK